MTNEEKDRLVSAYERGRLAGREEALRDLLLESQSYNAELLDELKRYEKMMLSTT